MTMSDLERRRELEQVVTAAGGRVLFYHPLGVNAEFRDRKAALDAYAEATLRLGATADLGYLGQGLLLLTL
jgi:hypothetical protein